jgi:hypothetical protein
MVIYNCPKVGKQERDGYVVEINSVMLSDAVVVVQWTRWMRLLAVLKEDSVGNSTTMINQRRVRLAVAQELRALLSEVV